MSNVINLPVVKCGDKYHGNFFTKLIRDDTFALVYWYDANPGVEVKPWEAGA